jgi:bleomycin hydrolase
MRPFFSVSVLFVTMVSLLASAARGDEGVAAAVPGELSPALLEDLRESFEMDDETRVRHNAVANNSINDLALNRGIIAGQDGHFSHKIDFKGITNQKASGRCWLFAGLNTMRPKVIREKKLPEFEFSVAYLQFWDKMEKANLFLETMIEMRETSYLDREWEHVLKWTMGDGGWWNFVVDLIEKYGVVPKDVMPETQSSENTKVMNAILDRKLQADTVTIRKMHADGASVDELRAFKERSLKEIYRFLVINLGEPPTKFEWRYAVKKKDNETESLDAANESKVEDLTPAVTYTPQEFYEQFVGVRLSDYVCLYSDPLSAFHKHYRFTRSKNVFGKPDMNFVNLPIDDLKIHAMQSIVANEPVWFAANVGRDRSDELGIMANRLYDYDPLFGLDTKVGKADRLKLRAGASNHAMALMGVDIRDGKPVKWLVENSWGKERGDQGTYTLHDDWFDEHVYNIIIHKRHVPADVLKVFEEEAIALPPWYPSAEVVR